MNNYGDPRFNSPPMGIHRRDRYQSTPTDTFQQRNSFQRNPYRGSPGYNNNHPNMHLSRNSSPYQTYRNSSKSFNSSATSSPEQWNRSNQSFSSGGSSSYFADVSLLSPVNSLVYTHIVSDPPPPQNLETRYQLGRQFQYPGKSKPSHSNNIRDYVHYSMVEDPWKDLMAEIKKKKVTPKAVSP